MTELYHADQMPSLPSTRVCIKCGIEKPLTDFPRYKRNPLGVAARCKVCHLAYYYSPIPKLPPLPPNPLTKVCTKCKERKSLSDFPLCNKSKDGVGFHCKACHRAYSPSKVPVQQPLPFFRVCISCHIEKPIDAFHKAGLEGKWHSICKECREAKRKRQADMEKGQVPLTKVCTKCQVERSIEHFYKNRYNTDGYFARCKACVNRTGTLHRELKQSEERPPRKRRPGKPTPYRHLRKIDIKAYYRARKADPEQKQIDAEYYRANRERIREATQKRREANPLKYIERLKRREALKKGAKVGTVSYERILERDGYVCHICGGVVTPEQLCFDHVIPLTPRKGTNRQPGPHSEDNIKVAHFTCNVRKSNLLMEELTDWHKRGPDVP